MAVSPITITATLQSIFGVSDATGFVDCELQNWGTGIPTIPGQCVISTLVQSVQAVSGAISFTVYPNDTIVSAGVSNTWYKLTYRGSAGGNVVSLAYQILSTNGTPQDLSTLAPITSFPASAAQTISPVVTNPTGPQTIATFPLTVVGLNVTSQGIDVVGNSLIQGNLTVSGPISASEYFVGLSQIAAANLADGTTGTGSICLATSPTLVTPNLGTPSAINLTNATGFPTLNQNTTGNAATATLATSSSGLKSASTTVVVSAATAPTTGQVLTATSSTAATWQSPASNPMTTQGDMIYENSSPAPARLAIGTSGQVLTVTGGLPVWANASSGFSNPMTTAGDIIIENATPAPARLAIGGSGQVLTVVSGAPAWANAASGFTNPMSTLGDLMYENASPAAARLAGNTTAAKLFLTQTGTGSVSAAPAWAAIAGADITSGAVGLTFGGTGANLSATGGTSQVLKQVSSGAAITVAQLAFSDISGSVAAGQLPNPSASTLGGIESLAAVTSKWINTISTSGVPSATQPAFTDISGTASTAQLPARTGAISYVIDGGGSVPATGLYGQITVPAGCTITGWYLTANASGSAVVAIKHSTFAAFPTTGTISASAPPTLSSAQSATSSTLTGWTTALAAGDQVQFNLTSITTCTRLNITLIVSIPYA